MQILRVGVGNRPSALIVRSAAQRDYGAMNTQLVDTAGSNQLYDENLWQRGLNAQLITYRLLQ